jgi:hypothetical protein
VEILLIFHMLLYREVIIVVSLAFLGAFVPGLPFCGLSSVELGQM